MIFVPRTVEVDETAINDTADWTEFYGNVAEEDPPGMPVPLGNLFSLVRYVGCRRVVFVAQTATFCVVSATCRDTSLVMSQIQENVVSAGCPKRHDI